MSEQQMKKILNDPAAFVDETLEGILLAHPSRLRSATADGRALVRGDAPRSGKVGIVTGGGSGHLPVFLGYVGVGLLDGVAVGNVFSSPSSAQIHAATVAVDGGAGVLYLYGNYGGDIYNFDIAADLAAADGISTTTVLAADDVASAPPERRESRRGVAGMIYAFKIAGAAAERGWNLDRVTAVARKVGDNTRTMGIGLSPTILPAAGEPTFEIAPGEMEVGIGIHGEPGIHRGPFETADAIADRLLGAILDDLPVSSGSTVSVLVNGMGATPLEELYVLYRRVHHLLTERGVSIHSPLVGEYVTSLEMAGASISVIVLDDELRELLDDPASSPFFRHGDGPAVGGMVGGEPVVHPQSARAASGGEQDAAADVDAEPTAFAALLLDVLARMPQHAEELRALDAALGDGDLGITVSSGSAAARTAILQAPGAADALLLRRVGAAFADANPSTFAALAGGGLIYAAGRLGTAGGDPLDPTTALRLVSDLTERIRERGGAEPGDKTVVDALLPSIAAGEQSTASGSASSAEVLDAMISAVRSAIDESAGLQSARGRAAWLQERSVGEKDPGMVAYLRLLEELRAAVA